MEGSIKVPQRVIRLISLIESGGVKNDIVEEEFRQLRDDADVDIAEARSIAQEMDSKSDKDTVIPSRKAVEAEYNRFITTFEEVKKYGNVRDAGSAFKGQLSSLRDTCVAIEASLGNYNAEFLALNQKKAQERDELERKRLETTENAGFYKK